MELFLDFETKCPHDIKAVGLDVYSRAATVLMLGWAIDDADPQLWIPDYSLGLKNLHLMSMPPELRDALDNAESLVAWNVSFERTIFAQALARYIPAARWNDPSVLSRYAGYPSRLVDACAALGLPADHAKDKDGKRLIRKFCVPKKDGSYRDAKSDPADWAKFESYCLQDIVAERAVLRRLHAFSLPVRERALWELDQKINEAGIPVDTSFVSSARSIASVERNKLLTEMRELTGLANPNSVKQLVPWLKQRGYPFDSLGAKRVTEALG